MRNFLDTASIAQSLDGERLMGCLHYPGQRISLDQSDYKTETWNRACYAYIRLGTSASQPRDRCTPFLFKYRLRLWLVDLDQPACGW